MAVLPRVYQGSIATMEASSSPIYSAGAWSFKNSSGVTTLSVSDAGGGQFAYK